ncbi:MAG: DUF362 domain-containing protein [Ruminococcaceae bacterium]|nr:DUF362 domain-containing protein [Oscillospiraceae bacterium]
MTDVSIVPCSSYEAQDVKKALQEVLSPIGGLDWVTPGMKIAIKANLVSMMKPEAAATTHPALLCALVEELKNKGALVVIGDSPGGLYNSVFVNRIYSATGMKDTERYGAVLNQNFSNSEAAFPDAMVTKSFTYTAYLDEADAIINFCKLKTHGMMGMSASVKNMFGVVPGTFKPEYHFRFPDHKDFAKMLIDLNTYFAPKVKLCLVDAVVGMEGNGPTQGKPRKIGAVLASANPHALDLACASIIGLDPADVPTLQVAHEMGIIPESAEKLTLYGDLASFVISDFQNIHVRRSLQFEGHGRFAAMFVKSALQASPIPKKKECIGCKKCAEICPAKAIEMKNGFPVIDKKKCITCFCCQEFCPKGAMKVHRPLIARILNHRK